MTGFASLTVKHEYNIIEFRTSYDPDFIIEIKSVIPRQLRMWDSIEKIWKVLDIEYLPDVQSLCNKYYHRVTVTNVWPVNNGNMGGKFDLLFSMLSKEHKKAVYKTLA